MPSPFLSDDTMWHLVCAARLAEIDPQGCDPKAHAALAQRLQADPHFARMLAVQAAEAFIATADRRAA